jgi:hypothetical protein
MPIGTSRCHPHRTPFAFALWQRMLTAVKQTTIRHRLLFVLFSTGYVISPTDWASSKFARSMTKSHNMVLTRNSFAFVDIDYTPPRLLTTKIIF